MTDYQGLRADEAIGQPGRVEKMLTPDSAWLRPWWRSLNLVHQFALTAAAVIGLAMTLLGWWASTRIEAGVVEHAAAYAALNLDNFVEPHLQSMASGEPLTKTSEQALTALSAQSEVGQEIVGLTIWDTNGQAIFSTRPNGINPAVTAPPQVRKAWAGSVESTFDRADLNDPAGERVLKVFAPMHHKKSHRVIAVVELHEAGTRLGANLQRMRVRTAAVVGLLSLAMLASLFGIVRRGSQTIIEQRLALTGRVNELSNLLSQNEDLQRRVIDANRRSADTNDRFLRKVGADLHDGPVQLIALSLLQLEALKPAGPTAAAAAGPADTDVDAIETTLRDALKEIRDLCSGLALPNLDGIWIGQVISYAVMNHERRSRTKVTTELADNLMVKATPLLLTCVYRFTQEGLSNAVRHANGKGQMVRATFDGHELEIEVSDDGPGFADCGTVHESKGLGLAGMRDRIQSLGGTFAVGNKPSGGLRVNARLSLDNEGLAASPSGTGAAS